VLKYFPLSSYISYEKEKNLNLLLPVHPSIVKAFAHIDYGNNTEVASFDGQDHSHYAYLLFEYFPKGTLFDAIDSG